jgi:hypothetical protein
MAMARQLQVELRTEVAEEAALAHLEGRRRGGPREVEAAYEVSIG